MKKRKTLRKLVILFCILLFCIMQNKWLTVSFYTYESDKVTSDLQGYRIVQISDLHNVSFGTENRRLLKRIEKLQPDMIVLTGDMVDSNFTRVDVAINFGKECVDLAPTYFVTGNHENWLKSEEKQGLLDDLKQAGVICLEDEISEVVKENGKFTLIGLDDESLVGNRLEMLVKEVDNSRLQILLAHEPQYLEHYATTGVDLVFSGHAHGGQVRLPFVGGVVAPGQGIFPKYTEGEHVQGETTMVISRGLGNSVIPVRLFNPPEIVCVELASPD